jgi:hypothetical protein
MTRRLIAGGAGVIVLILLVLVVKGCRDSARKQAFRDYYQRVNGLVQDSNQESKAVFDLLTKPGSSSIDLGSNVNAYRGAAVGLVDRAKALDHPSELNGAQNYLVAVLELRRDGLTGIAKELPTLLGDSGQEDAAKRIAVYMRNFVGSDVLYTEKVVPGMHRPAKAEGLEDEAAVPKSHFLTDLGWLSSGVVAERIARIGNGGSGGTATKPGIHGTGLGPVTVKPGGQTLSNSGATEIASSPNLSFDVQVMNQGENDETQVPVKVTISGAGKPIVVQSKIDSIAAGQSKTVSVPLAASPPTGRPVTINVQVVGVPGEKNLDNNKGSFAAVFTG